jgi:hypothetical protein
LISGSGNGLARIQTLRDAYLEALKRGGAIAIPGVTSADWLTAHVPALIAAMDAGGVTDDRLRALLLAAADYDTQQGKFMVEADR